MHADSRLPNEAQRQKLCEMLFSALVEIRAIARTHPEQAHDLADAFHNLPRDMWQDYFSISFFRRAFLQNYADRWKPAGSGYLTMLDEVEKLG